MTRPDLVSRMVTIGANFHYEGLLPAEFDESVPVGDMIMQGYAERSPDGVEHFGDVYERMLTMMTTEPTLTAIAETIAPTLVMAGDDDLMRPTTACALYEACCGGQLAIVPGTSHILVRAPGRGGQDHQGLPHRRRPTGDVDADSTGPLIRRASSWSANWLDTTLDLQRGRRALRRRMAYFVPLWRAVHGLRFRTNRSEGAGAPVRSDRDGSQGPVGRAAHPAGPAGRRSSCVAAGVTLITVSLAKFMRHEALVDSFERYGLPWPDASVYVRAPSSSSAAHCSWSA